MRLLFIGSIPGHKPGTGQLPKLEHQPLFKAAEELGYAGAVREHIILVCGESRNTIDYYIAQGVKKFCEEHPEKEVFLEIHHPQDAKALYLNLPINLKISRFSYHMDESSTHKWIVTHVRALDSTDVLITLGGGKSTRIVGNIFADRLAPVVAIACFGGTSVGLNERLRFVYRNKLGPSTGLDFLTGSWSSNSAEEIIGVAESLGKSRPSEKPYSYFISYDWNDSAIADHVETLLRRQGRNVLRDEQNVESGGKLSKTIQTMIDEADTFIALWGNTYSSSTWCPDELEYARNRQAKGNKPKRIVLLTLDDTVPPIRFTDSLHSPAKERKQRELAIMKMLNQER